MNRYNPYEQRMIVTNPGMNRYNNLQDIAALMPKKPMSPIVGMPPSRRRNRDQLGMPKYEMYGGANYGKSPLSSSPTSSKSLGLKNIARTIESADKTYKEVKGVTAGLKNFLNNFGETGQGYANWLTSYGLGKPKRSRKMGMGLTRVVGGANYGKSPLSSSPTSSKSLGLKNISRTIESADKTYKEVKGVTAGLKNFLNNFGETGQGYSNWLTSWGLGKPKRGRKGGKFAGNAALMNMIFGRGQEMQGGAWNLAGLKNELFNPDSYARGTWLPNAAAAGQAAALASIIFGPEAPPAVEAALAPLTAAAGINELLRSRGYGMKGGAVSGGNVCGSARPRASRGSDGRAARAAVVRKVMQDRGVSLPMASKIVKQEGLYNSLSGGAVDMNQYSGLQNIRNNSRYADWATRAVEKPLPNVQYVDQAPNQYGDDGSLL
jgi:hypothetical protein